MSEFNGSDERFPLQSLHTTVQRGYKQFVAEYQFDDKGGPTSTLQRTIEAPTRAEAAAKVALELTQGIAVYTARSEEAERASETAEDADDTTGEVVVVNAATVRYVRIFLP
jgi:hypothetical protein